MGWKDAFVQVRERLKTEANLAPKEIAVLNSPKVRYMDDVVETKMLDVLKPAPDFSGYEDEKTVRKTRNFVRRHARAFAAAEKESGPPRHIVAAVLMVETRLGKYPSRHSVLNVLMSLSALGVPEFGNDVAEQISKTAAERFPGAEPVDWKARASQIGEKWFAELVAYFELCRIEGWNPRKIKGSWAGAIGHGQFMPTTALRNMKRDGETWAANLRNWNDTIRLTARHLEENGWTAQATEEQRKEAVRKYNGRAAYADAVFRLAELVEEKPAAPTK